MVPSSQRFSTLAPHEHIPSLLAFSQVTCIAFPMTPTAPGDLCSGLLCPQGASCHLMGLGPCSLPGPLTGRSPHRKGFHLFAARNAAWHVAGAQRHRTGSPRAAPGWHGGPAAWQRGSARSCGRVSFPPCYFSNSTGLLGLLKLECFKGKFNNTLFLGNKSTTQRIKTRIPALDK